MMMLVGGGLASAFSLIDNSLHTTFCFWFICLNESTTHGGLFLSFPPSPLLLAPPFKQISISHGDFTYICLYYIDAFVRLWLFRELSSGESGDHYPSICLLISQRLKAGLPVFRRLELLPVLVLCSPLNAVCVWGDV